MPVYVDCHLYGGVGRHTVQRGRYVVQDALAQTQPVRIYIIHRASYELKNKKTISSVIDTECQRLDGAVPTIHELAPVKGSTQTRAAPRLRSGVRGRCTITVASTPGVKTYENSDSPYGPRYNTIMVMSVEIRRFRKIFVYFIVRCFRIGTRIGRTFADAGDELSAAVQVLGPAVVQQPNTIRTQRIGLPIGFQNRSSVR